MRSFIRNTSATLIAGSSLILGVLAACSDDDPTSVTAPDSGLDSSGNQETGPNDQCPPQEAPSCTAAKCTTDPNDPQVCVAGQCVKMKSPDCQKVGGDLEGGNVLVIGVSLAQTGSNGTSGTARINSLELAIKEVNAAGGVRDADRCKAPRTLAYVACDDTNTAALPDAGPDAGPLIDRIRGAEHLINDLKVPVIVGASTSGNTLDLAKNATVPGKVMQFAPSSTAIAITNPADFNASPDGTRLLWRAAPSDVVQSIVLQKMFLQVETELKAKNGNAAIKLALVTKNDAYGKGIAEAFKNGLMINGAAPTDTSFTDIVYKTADADPDGIARSTAATQLGTFQPDIVVMAGTSEATDDIMRPFEATNPSKKPIYVLADGQKKPELTALVDPADTKTPAPGDREGLRKRIRGTQPGVLTTLAQTFFNVAYKEAYGADSVLSYGMAGTYDIGYMITYALTASKGAAVTGTDLAKNMALLTGGTQKIDVGPTGLPKGMEAMLKGEKIDFNGASGPLDFDVATGEAPSDYGIWCVKIDPNNNARVYEEATGQSYSATTGALTGTFTCP